MRFIYATPKPRPSIEIRLDRMPRHTALVVVLLTMATVISTVALWASMHSNVLDIPKLPTVPNVSAEIQQSVDKALSPKEK
jgi:hypothetical protein